MKVKELIAELSKYADETMVVVNGFECGYDEVGKVGLINLEGQLGYEEDWGQYSKVETYKTKKANYPLIVALSLSRK